MFSKDFSFLGFFQSPALVPLVLSLGLALPGLVLFSQGVQATPDVTLEGLDGKQHKLSEYIGNGKWTAVNIWGTKCPPCREEMPELVLFHDAHMNKDATILGIAIDFPTYRYAKKDEVAKFVDDYLVGFPVLLSDSSITERIGAGRLEGLPSTYMFTPEGELVGYQVGGITGEIIEKYIKRYESRQKAKQKVREKK